MLVLLGGVFLFSWLVGLFVFPVAAFGFFSVLLGNDLGILIIVEIQNKTKQTLLY